MPAELKSRIIANDELEVGDTIMFLGKGYRVTSFEPYDGPLSDIVSRIVCGWATLRQRPTGAGVDHEGPVAFPMHIAYGKAFYAEAIRDVLRVTLALSRLATVGVLCGDPQVTIREEAVR